MKTRRRNNIKLGWLQKKLEFLPPKKMKISYKVVFYLLFVFAILLSFMSCFSLLGCDSKADRLIQILTGLAIAVAAVVALSSTDPKKETVKISIEKPYIIDGEKEIYDEHELHKSIKSYYKKFPVISYRVHFKVKNISEFDLKNPVITFNKLPIEKQRPYSETGNKLYSTRCFSFSIVRADRKPYFLVVDKKYHLLSINGLPYWNRDSEIDLWIRMVLDGGGLEEFDVDISVNCENSDGMTKPVKINPKKLSSTVGELWNKDNPQ